MGLQQTADSQTAEGPFTLAVWLFVFHKEVARTHDNQRGNHVGVIHG